MPDGDGGCGGGNGGGGATMVGGDDLAEATGPEADAAWDALVAQHPEADVLDSSIIVLPANGSEPEPAPESKLEAACGDAGSRANTVGGVVASVANAGEAGAAAAAALEYADYLSNQRENGWKD